MRPEVVVDSPEVLARFHGELPLVDIIARQVRAQLGEVLDLDEMLSFGREGLLEAARRFEPDRGVSFRRFANYRVRGAILDGMRSHGRMSRRTWEKVRALRNALSVSEGMQEDSAAAVAGGVRGKQADDRLADYVASMATAMAMGLVAESAVGEEGEPVACAGATSPEQEAETSELMRLARTEIGKLPEREATLIRRHFLRGEDIDEVAASLGLSKSWGSRLLARGMNTLSKRLHAPVI